MAETTMVKATGEVAMTKTAMAKTTVTTETTVPKVASRSRDGKGRQRTCRYQTSGSLIELEHWLLL
jgi:hypothetical protein